MESEQKKAQKWEACRYSHACMRAGQIELHCHVDGWEDDKIKIIERERCETCEQFQSQYIEYPLTITGIENKFGRDHWSGGQELGSLVEVAPCGEEYGGKSYLGIYLGQLPISAIISHCRDTGVLSVSPMDNPAIFVPELKKIIYGCESWWRIIESEADFKGITKDDIDDCWYIQMLRSMYPHTEAGKK